MVAVIRLPHKSCTTTTLSFSNRKPPTSAPIRSTIRLRKRPCGALVSFAAIQPAISPTTIHASTPMRASMPALDVQHAAVGVEHRLFHHFRQRRMREDGVHQLFFGGLQIHRHHVALDQFGHLGTDHVRADERTGLLVEDDFDQPLVLAHRDRLAVADEGKAPDPHVDLLFLGGRLGQAHRGDLRLAIGAAGDHELVHGMRVETLDRLDAYNPFVLGLVREHGRAGDVADGVDARHVGATMAVDHDGAAVGLYPELLQSQVLDVADHADRRDDPLDRERGFLPLGVLDLRGHAVALLVELGDLGAGHDLDALLLERLAGEGGDLGILHREYLRQHLDDGHLRAERAEERGELDADRARTDHQQRLRHAVRHHRLEIGPHQFLVGLDAGQHARTRAGRDDDVLRLIGPGAERALGPLALRLHGDLAGRIDRRVAPDHGDLVLAHQKADAVVEALRYRTRALDHRLRVVADLLGREAVVLRVLHVVKDFRRAQQRLGRDAAPVEADAPEIIALDDCGFETELRRPDRSYVAARTGPDDDDVETGVGHRLTPPSAPDSRSVA